MDYSDLHDAEINMKVCAALGLGLSGHARIIRQDDATILLDDNETLVDYCNNPADAWPIIVENNISLILDNPSSPMATSNCVGWYSDEEPPIHASNQNPLRAAMIVFLMMQESANVPANPARPDIR